VDDLRVDERLASYLAFTTLLVITPGSATAVVVRNVLAGGARRGMAAAAGAAAGNTTYAVLTIIGVAALLAESPRAFMVLRAAGTLYLAYLGLRSLWMALSGRRTTDRGERSADGGERIADRGSRSAGFRQGFATNLVNPAIATFYLVAVPSFLNNLATERARYTLYAAIHVTMAFAYHSTWVWALDSMRAFWSRPAARRALEAITGVALIALAIRVSGVFR
jgi:threonine/homoserine/homoserine lactone efflux protein